MISRGIMHLLERKEKAFQKKLAEKAQEIVIKYCKKYNLTFIPLNDCGWVPSNPFRSHDNEEEYGLDDCPKEMTKKESAKFLSFCQFLTEENSIVYKHLKGFSPVLGENSVEKE